jgi:hypothetical protein
MLEFFLIYAIHITSVQHSTRMGICITYKSVMRFCYRMRVWLISHSTIRRGSRLSNEIPKFDPLLFFSLANIALLCTLPSCIITRQQWSITSHHWELGKEWFEWGIRKNWRSGICTRVFCMNTTLHCICIGSKYLNWSGKFQRITVISRYIECYV